MLIDAVLVEAEAAVRDGHEPRLRLRVAAREQRDVVTLRDELVGEPRDDTLGSAVVLRRNALVQRSDLSDAHSSVLRLLTSARDAGRSSSGRRPRLSDGDGSSGAG